MQHLEIESKFELSAEDFEILKHLGVVIQRKQQLNVYYDTHWKLADSASTLRIRFDDDSDPVLTLKVPVARTGPKRTMREFEFALPAYRSVLSRSRHPAAIDVGRELPQELSDCLLFLGVNRVERVGWVRNTRFVLAIESFGQIELDRLELPDGSVVHEAEIESHDPGAHEYLARLVCERAPAATPSKLSKFQRFRDAVTTLLKSTEELP